jgi:hypothetical protein
VLEIALPGTPIRQIAPTGLLTVEKDHRHVSRRPATITQADLARAIRAAKQAGAAEVEVHVGKHSRIIIRITPSTGDDMALEEGGEIVL